MRWLPEIYLSDATTCYPDEEYDGRTLVVRWRRWVIELTIARAPTACRVCGCTENYACVTEDGPCTWAEPELCTACAPKDRA